MHTAEISSEDKESEHRLILLIIELFINEISMQMFVLDISCAKFDISGVNYSVIILEEQSRPRDEFISYEEGNPRNN